MVYAPVRPEAALPPVLVNLYSDTQTKPSAAMKAAMLRAEVGDEQHGDDPTIHELCDRMAALLGKEAAELYRALPVSDQALTRERYLRLVEAVPLELRQRYLKVYAYY